MQKRGIWAYEMATEEQNSWCRLHLEIVWVTGCLVRNYCPRVAVVIFPRSVSQRNPFYLQDGLACRPEPIFHRPKRTVRSGAEDPPQGKYP